MGEFADMALDGIMDYDEAYINGDFDWMQEDGPYYPALSSRTRVVKLTTKTCKHCGQIDLIWIETDKGWRLHQKDGEIHNCFKKKSPN